jgi:hypothetical protein
VSTASDHPLDRPDWVRFQRGALIAGAAGLGLALLGGFFSREQFFRSYLVAYCFWLGVTLGSLAIVMLQHLTGGAWGFVIRRLLESATRTLPWLALLFVPLLFGLQDLYAWARLLPPPGLVTVLHAIGLEQLYDSFWPNQVPREVSPHDLVHRQAYLNIPFFILRVVLYFAIWNAFAYYLNRLSREQDRTADPRLLRRLRVLSGPGLGIYGLTITFAAIDWIMSLEPHWYSTIFGAILATGQVLSALAFAIALLILLSRFPPLDRVLTTSVMRDLGSLMLAFVMLWAYMAFSQFLLTWAGNLPEEISWYRHRLTGGWQWLGLALILFQFVLPFLLLLSADIKRNRRTLSAVAGLVLVMRFADLYWMIEATPSVEGLGIHWIDLVALVGVGGVWLAVFVGQLRKMPLLPQGEAQPGEATHHA